MTGIRFGSDGVAIERLDISAYTVPTDFPESDGTITWDSMLFDGALTPVHGSLRPDLSRPDTGLELKCADAAKYAV